MLTMYEPACSLRGVHTGKDGVFQGGPVNIEHGGHLGDQDWGCATGLLSTAFRRQTDGQMDPARIQCKWGLV